MTAQAYDQAWSFVTALTGDANVAVMDFRAIHDNDKTIPAIPFRGTLGECWQSIVSYNNQGYGIFSVIAAMDGGEKRELANVQYLRGHYVDLDGLDAQQQYEKACAFNPAPAFAVNSSYGPLKDGNGKPTDVLGHKYHVYWPCNGYYGNDRFTVVQRKLRQLFNSDKVIIDATRVMRLPGTLHTKRADAPHLVTMWALNGWGTWTNVETLEYALQSVNVIDGGIGTRHELGDPDLSAPSLDWIDFALKLLDPNQLDRGEWISITAAIKQAGWLHTDPDTLFNKWSNWCAQYSANDPGENLKQWNSIRNTELGWPSLLRRVPSLSGANMFGGIDRTGQLPPSANLSGTPAPLDPAPAGTPPTPAPVPPSLDCSGEYLTHVEQQHWFRGCVFVINQGDMLTRDGRFLNSTQFNGAFGGKQFIIDTLGKKTNEAWAAALRSTLWTVPKVDHIRFIPSAPFMDIIEDDLGRTGVNIYRPANVRRLVGDPSPFLNHLSALLPNPGDQRIILDFLAHNARFPGHKIPWAPVIQSTEGAGKGVLKLVMKHAMGKSYVYFPKADQLAKTGGQFNAWLRHKLFILVDEIRVDERRELIEVLKPIISEDEAEIQPKGVDQELHDNFSNWLFFTNWKDAIPVNKNARRFAIMYSPLQTVDDLMARGMNQAYFDALYGWLEGDGGAIVADFLMNYPIERGAIPMRAPETSSTGEAVALSRGPIERLIIEAVEDGIAGFRGGWISATAVAKRVKEAGAVRSVSASTIATIIEALGYVACGRAPRVYFQEDKDSRGYVFHWAQRVDPAGYGRAQGYE